MKKKRTWLKISKIGDQIKRAWAKIFKKYGYDVSISGIRSIPSFSFNKKNKERSTFFTQEMLKRGYLAGNLIFVSIAHKKDMVEKYLKEFDKTIFKMYEIEKK